MVSDKQLYLLALKRDPCSYCLGPGYGLDHIDARSRGGTNIWTNYTSACQRCDSRKANLPLLLALLFRVEIERLVAESRYQTIELVGELAA